MKHATAAIRRSESTMCKIRNEANIASVRTEKLKSPGKNHKSISKRIILNYFNLISSRVCMHRDFWIILYLLYNHLNMKQWCYHWKGSTSHPEQGPYALLLDLHWNLTSLSATQQEKYMWILIVTKKAYTHFSKQKNIIYNTESSTNKTKAKL